MCAIRYMYFAYARECLIRANESQSTAKPMNKPASGNGTQPNPFGLEMGMEQKRDGQANGPSEWSDWAREREREGANNQRSCNLFIQCLEPKSILIAGTIQWMVSKYWDKFTKLILSLCSIQPQNVNQHLGLVYRCLRIINWIASRESNSNKTDRTIRNRWATKWGTKWMEKRKKGTRIDKQNAHQPHSKYIHLFHTIAMIYIVWVAFDWIVWLWL